MKKIVKSLAVILLACTCVLAGCGGKKGLSDNPATDATVIGNGGYAVQKGEYLYYVNGYIDNYTTELQSNPSLNKDDNAIYGAIYRTKLTNGKVGYDDNGFVEKTERVVSNVVGFENGGFYILGDYIYYTSPHMNKDDSGKIRTDYTEFKRIKINGLDEERLYTSKSTGINDWQVYDVDGTAYVVLVEKVADSEGVTNTKVVAINGKTEKSQTLVENIDNAVLNDEVYLNVKDKKHNAFVYYTITNDDSVNKLGKVNITNGNKDEYVLISNATYSLVDFNNDSLYLTITNNSITCLNRLDLTSDASLTNANRVELTATAYNNYYTIDGVLNDVIVVDSSNNMSYIRNRIIEKNLLTSAVTVVGLSDNCVYYIENSALKRINYVNADAEVESLGDSEKKYLLNLASQVDINGRNIFVFTEYTPANTEGENASKYYLNYINLESPATSKFVGQFAADHTPAKPSDEEIADGKVWIR